MTREFYCVRVSDSIRHERSLEFVRLQFSNMAKKTSVPEVTSNVFFRAYFWDEVPIPQSE